MVDVKLEWRLLVAKEDGLTTLGLDKVARNLIWRNGITLQEIAEWSKKDFPKSRHPNSDAKEWEAKIRIGRKQIETSSENSPR